MVRFLWDFFFFFGDCAGLKGTHSSCLSLVLMRVNNPYQRRIHSSSVARTSPSSVINNTATLKPSTSCVHKNRSRAEAVVLGADFCQKKRGVMEQCGGGEASCPASPRVCCSGCVSDFTHNCAVFISVHCWGFSTEPWISSAYVLFLYPENTLSPGCLWPQ